MLRGDRDSGDASQLNPAGVLFAMYEEDMRNAMRCSKPLGDRDRLLARPLCAEPGAGGR